MDHIESVEKNDQGNQKEIHYNCTQCSSPIEISAINEIGLTTEFKCANNNHLIKTSIKDFFDKMKSFSNNDINNDKCKEHGNLLYESYCTKCEKHLCKECLKLRKHIDHLKINIIEIQPNDEELNKLESIIKSYTSEITKIENEKTNLAKNIDNELKQYKEELFEKKDLAIKDNKNFAEKEKEIELNEDKKITNVDNIRKKYLNNILKNLGYDERLEKLNNLKRLYEIIYNTYNCEKNNYYNSINIRNILVNKDKNDKLSEEFKKEEKIKNLENKLKKIEDEYNKFKIEYEKNHINDKAIFKEVNCTNGDKYEGELKEFKILKPHGKGKYFFKNGGIYEGEFKNGLREGKGIMEYKTGKKYDGEWKNDLRQGKGTLYYSAKLLKNDKYVGEYKNGKKQGNGILYYKKGNYYDYDRVEGIWDNGRRKKGGTIYLKDGNAEPDFGSNTNSDSDNSHYSFD